VVQISREKAKDFAAGLIALVFVVTAGYLALNRFNESKVEELGIGGEQIVVDGNDISADSTIRQDGNLLSTETAFSTWVANDYEVGDINTGEYTVVEGDTLWEIAEAVYGDGSMWTQILNANSEDVGFLPNGEQALIVIGQSLIIP